MPSCIATWATGMQQFDRYTGALPSRHRWVSMPSFTSLARECRELYTDFGKLTDIWLAY